MKERESLFPARHTTSAIGPNGRTIYFDDLVADGEAVEVEGRKMFVYFDPEAPDWFVDEHSDACCKSTQGGLCARHAREVHGA